MICAAAARELAEETALLTSALAVEFETTVPTHALRERIDAAVLGVRVANAERAAKSGFFASLANVFSFNSQRNLGYASLVVLLAFGAIIGVVKYRQSGTTVETTGVQATVQPGSNASVSNPEDSSRIEVASGDIESVVPDQRRAAPVKVKFSNRSSAPKVNPVRDTVQLLPGERSYLQTIARLDTTIKSNKNSMRPSLQVEYERNLAVVDRAIAATRNAAKSNPNDPDAADFMFAAYQSKVDLLNTIADARLGGGRSH